MNATETPGHLARRFHQIAVAVFHAEAEAAGFDLTPVQYAALAKIGDEPGLDQATLAGLIAQDRTTMGGVVDRLVEKDLVLRETSKKDRRARELRLTEEGKRTLKQVAPAVAETQRILLSGLSEKEAAQFMKLLGKAIAALNDLSRAPLRDA
ncbi:MAG TPA: MarR family transcriptional regulator [Rhodoblastus sp.]|nr:MarR family transcriptional regulator [Rhodoblastus sp.]